jgi:hypothetical protein
VIHDEQLPLLVTPGRWRPVVGRGAFNGRELSFKAPIPGVDLLVEEGAAGILARMAVMALARSESRAAAALPNSVSFQVPSS